MQRPIARLVRLSAGIGLAAALLSCGDSGDPTRPPHSTTPTGSTTLPPKPVITLSTDSVAAIALAGAAASDFTVIVGAADTTSVRGLTATTAAADGDAGWLSAQLDGAVAPATLAVHIDPKTAAVGVHTATISIAATSAEPKTVRVQLTVRAHPVLLLDSAARFVSANIGDSIPALAFSIHSSSDSIGGLSLGAPVCDDHPWVNASLSGVSTPAVVTLAIKPSGLASGTFVCRIDVKSSQALVDSTTRTIIVSLTMRQAPRIALDRTSLALSTEVGTNTSAPTSVAITNGGTGVLDGLSIGAVTYNGPSGWLTAKLDSGTAPTALRLTPSAQSLSAGAYTATVPVQSTASGVTNNPAVVTVTLTVNPKPYRFVIAPSTIAVSYSISTGKFTTATVSFYDANASGQVASFVHFLPTQSNGSGTCPMFSYGGPNLSSPVLPQTYTFMVGAFQTTPPPLGTCTFRFTAQLDNGQSGTLVLTSSIVP